MAVRSRRLFGPVAIGNVLTIVYTVPAGRTARVSSLRWTDVSVGSTVFVSVNGATAGSAAVGALGSAELTLTGTWVWNPGDVIRAQTTAPTGSGSLWASGSLLLGAPS